MRFGRFFAMVVVVVVPLYWLLPQSRSLSTRFALPGSAPSTAATPRSRVLYFYYGENCRPCLAAERRLAASVGETPPGQEPRFRIRRVAVDTDTGWFPRVLPTFILVTPEGGPHYILEGYSSAGIVALINKARGMTAG